MAVCGHRMTGRKRRNSVSQASVVLENAAEKTPAHLCVARLRLWTLRLDFNLTHTKGGVAARVSQTWAFGRAKGEKRCCIALVPGIRAVFFLHLIFLAKRRKSHLEDCIFCTLNLDSHSLPYIFLGSQTPLLSFPSFSFPLSSLCPSFLLLSFPFHSLLLLSFLPFFLPILLNLEVHSLAQHQADSVRLDVTRPSSALPP